MHLLKLLLLSSFICSLVTGQDLAPATSADTAYRQYYKLLTAYQNGEKEYSYWPYLINTARELKNEDLSNKIAQDYINNYLFKLGKKELLSKDNIILIRSHTQDSDSKGFEFFRQHTGKIDDLMENRGYAYEMISYIIIKETIEPFFIQARKDGSSPDWARSEAVLKKKYSSNDAAHVMIDAKLMWYAEKKDWIRYCNNVVKKVERYGPYGLFSIDVQYNEIAWDLFLHSNDQNELRKALAWSNKAIELMKQPNATYYDTYANLLYKLGRKEEALKYEEKAVSMNPKDKGIEEAYLKMKNGTPTWPDLAHKNGY